jgi:hypothetical protein
VAEGDGFAKAARNHRTGLKLTISGPFFIGLLVGVGWPMMVFGPRLGTLLGTLSWGEVAEWPKAVVC